MQTSKQVHALFETYATLRAIYYAERNGFPEAALMAAESAACLLIAFPILEKLEGFIRLGEAELAIRSEDGKDETQGTGTGRRN